MNENPTPSGYSWRSWPVRERPGTLLLVAPVCAAALFAVYVFARGASWVAVGALLLFLGLREYFLPVRYKLDENGVHIDYLLWSRRKTWKDIRRVVPQKRGMLLSPFPAASRLEAYRGLYLRYDGHREEVLRVIKRFAGSADG